MIVRLISIAVFVSLASLVAPVNMSVLAATERATFILTDGERKSGPVVFHTESRENLINGYLNLGADNGKEQTFPVDQVAVIDFVGGRPPRAELQALPSDNDIQLLVLKSGSTQQGRFVNMIGGDTVRWQTRAGEQQQYPIRLVSRIYLNTQSARTVWNFRGTAQNAPVATSGAVLEAGAVRVEANQPWTDTGVTVRKGNRIAFRTTGQIQFMQAGENAGPDGNDAVRRADYPVTVMPVGGLIGKVGNSTPFPIGSNAQPIVMPADGRLMLGVNDNIWNDNSGYFAVVITKS